MREQYNMQEREPYVFVSYAREDHDLVRVILDGLRAKGINIWVDTQDLQPGEDWNSSIYQALKEAAGMIIFISPASMGSGYVRQEITAAAKGTKEFIIPVILEHVPDLPMSLAKYQWLDLSEDKYQNLPNAINKLASTVEARLAKSSRTSPGLRNEVAGRI